VRLVKDHHAMFHSSAIGHGRNCNRNYGGRRAGCVRHSGHRPGVARGWIEFGHFSKASIF
jgi:hypothetical protein